MVDGESSPNDDGGGGRARGPGPDRGPRRLADTPTPLDQIRIAQQRLESKDFNGKLVLVPPAP